MHYCSSCFALHPVSEKACRRCGQQHTMPASTALAPARTGRLELNSHHLVLARGGASKEYHAPIHISWVLVLMIFAAMLIQA